MKLGMIVTDSSPARKDDEAMQREEERGVLPKRDAADPPPDEVLADAMLQFYASVIVLLLVRPY